MDVFPEEILPGSRHQVAGRKRDWWNAIRIHGARLVRQRARISVRADWHSQLLILAVIALLGTLPFWWTDLDLRAIALFHHPGADDPWFQARQPLWAFLYVASPALTGILLVGAFGVVVMGTLQRRYRRLRLYAVFIVATVVVGPGLVVNGLFKDHWGRPRPHQVQEFGGTRDYLPPLAMGESGNGKSFPCGHSSVGFMLVAFFLVWRRSRPRLARLALVVAVILGGLFGVGRMMSGDHFLSDVIWSGVLVYGVALVLYYLAFRIPQREQAVTRRPNLGSADSLNPHVAVPVAVAGLSLLMAGVLFATPLKTLRQDLLTPGEFQPAPAVLRIQADAMDVSVFWLEADDADLRARIRLRARGFGLPWSRVVTRLDPEGKVLVYRAEHRGWFSEKDARLSLGINPGDWERIEVFTRAGDIQVMQRQGSTPKMDLHTGHGRLVSAMP